MPTKRGTFIQFERLLSRRVLDVDGKAAGRIEEVVIENRIGPQGGTCVITEYHLGPDALLERLSAIGFAAAIVHLLGGPSRHATHKARWEQMDLSDPLHPRLRVPIEALEQL